MSTIREALDDQGVLRLLNTTDVSLSDENLFITFVDSIAVWHINGEYYRLTKPNVYFPDESRRWFVNGLLHRPDGPAVEWSDGDQEWCVDGKLHRLDGPAIEWAGRKSWCIDAERLTEEQFNHHPLVIFYRLSLEHV
jgi:hypothetical protein